MCVTHRSLIEPSEDVANVTREVRIRGLWRRGSSPSLELALEEATRVDCCFVVADVSKALAEQVRVKDTVSPRLFESSRRGVYSLSGGSEGASGQHFDLLCMADLGSSVEYFLSCFKEFLSEVMEL